MSFYLLLFLVIIILSIILFFAIKFIAKLQLKKLRRNYNATEDTSRKPEDWTEPRGTTRDIGTKLVNEGNGEHEGRSILQNEPDSRIEPDCPKPSIEQIRIGEDKPGIEQSEQRGDIGWKKLLKPKKKKKE